MSTMTIRQAMRAQGLKVPKRPRIKSSKATSSGKRTRLPNLVKESTRASVVRNNAKIIDSTKCVGQGITVTQFRKPKSTWIPTGVERCGIYNVRGMSKMNVDLAQSFSARGNGRRASIKRKDK